MKILIIILLMIPTVYADSFSEIQNEYLKNQQSLVEWNNNWQTKIEQTHQAAQSSLKDQINLFTDNSEFSPETANDQSDNFIPLTEQTQNSLANEELNKAINLLNNQ